MQENLLTNPRALVLLAVRVFIMGLIIAGCSVVRGSDSWQNVSWEWINFTLQGSGKTITVPDPENFTIIFTSDGTISGHADCNTFAGTYTFSNDGSMSIDLIPDPLSTCGGETLDLKFINLLNETAAGRLDSSGEFSIDTASRTERLVFRNGGAAD
jgi:heat shock protein HslJ